MVLVSELANTLTLFCISAFSNLVNGAGLWSLLVMDPAVKLTAETFLVSSSLCTKLCEEISLSSIFYVLFLFVGSRAVQSETRSDQPYLGEVVARFLHFLPNNCSCNCSCK